MFPNSLCRKNYKSLQITLHFQFPIDFLPQDATILLSILVPPNLRVTSFVGPLFVIQQLSEASAPPDTEKTYR